METFSTLMDPCGQQWIPLTDWQWCWAVFLSCSSERAVERTFGLPLIWDVITLTWRHRNGRISRVRGEHIISFICFNNVSDISLEFVMFYSVYMKNDCRYPCLISTMLLIVKICNFCFLYLFFWIWIACRLYLVHRRMCFVEMNMKYINIQLYVREYHWHEGMQL